ncbi:hypothetical protein CBNA_0816 [Coxiella burnetii str. Namibia]|nr:hypothetical protein CBNA_0816 [Coxiella burnetii str. Namibia]
MVGKPDLCKVACIAALHTGYFYFSTALNGTL